MCVHLMEESMDFSEHNRHFLIQCIKIHGLDAVCWTTGKTYREKLHDYNETHHSNPILDSEFGTPNYASGKDEVRQGKCRTIR